MAGFYFVGVLMLFSIVSGSLVHEMKIPKNVGFSWENCTTKDAPVIVVKDFSLSPDPIQFGKDIELTLAVDVKENVGGDKPVNIDIAADLTVSGTSVDICTYKESLCHIKDVCTLINQQKFKCPSFLKALGITCKCPLLKASYQVHKIKIPIPNPPVTISGKFNATLKVSEGDRQIGCLALKFCLMSCDN